MLNPDVRDASFLEGCDFTEAHWKEIVQRSSRLFHLSDETAAKMSENKVMKLVAAIPFVAGCRNPMRIALSHISVYLLACLPGGKDVFLHKFSDNDSLFTRLERISHFDGGDRRIINRGMNMLAYAMMGDHLHDKDEDAAAGKYNPLNSGAWDLEKVNGQLINEIKSYECRRLDEIMNVAEGPESYWNNG